MIIDCPPNFNIVTKAAIVASQGYFIPAKPDYLSTLGIEQLNRHVVQLSKDYNDFCKQIGGQDYSAIDPGNLGVIFTMVKYYADAPINDQYEHIAAIRRLGVPLLNQMVRENNRFYSRRTDGKRPLVLQDWSDQTFWLVREELEELTVEVIGILARLGDK